MQSILKTRLGRAWLILLLPIALALFYLSWLQHERIESYQRAAKTALRMIGDYDKQTTHIFPLEELQSDFDELIEARNAAYDTRNFYLSLGGIAFLAPVLAQLLSWIYQFIMHGSKASMGKNNS